MEKLLVIVGLVCSMFVFVPTGSDAASESAATVPAACVVVSGPSGLNLQAGYAPNGPEDCQQV